MSKFVKCPVWDKMISDWLDTPKGIEVKETVSAARKQGTVYPDSKDLFRAFHMTGFWDTKVLILGQDPYYNGTADGLAFSCKGTRPSPSLQIIMQELMHTEYSRWNNEHEVFRKYNLDKWASEGVLLLNTALTVLQNKPGSHAKIGWNTLVIKAISMLQEHSRPYVVMLWGAYAQRYEPMFDPAKTLILKAVHPSAEAQNEKNNTNHRFVGCNHFTFTNKHLAETIRTSPIGWALI